tara:strand:- start:1114 stop:1287 length:174 start_codon:yes stop_codon:yes gene_type:complete
MKIEYSVLEDYGCHIDEPCWVPVKEGVSIDFALVTYKESPYDRKIVVSMIDDLPINI